MKQNRMVIIASLLSILLTTFHMTDDMLHVRGGLAQGGASNLIAVPILVLWLYGTLVLAERRLGYVIMLLGALLASGMPVIHMLGPGNVGGGAIARPGGDFFFVWTLLALGVTGVFSFILSAHGLWSLLRVRRSA